MAVDVMADIAHLEAKLEAGLLDSRDARGQTVGRLIVSGRLPVQMKYVSQVQAAFKGEPDAQVLDLDVSRIHGWKSDGKLLVGPQSWPGEDVDQVTLDELLASPSSSASSASSGGQESGGAISRGEARRQVRAAREWVDWAAQVRQRDIWTQAQERRAWMFGQVLVTVVMRAAGKRDLIRRRVAEDGDAAEIKLWSEDEIKADYTPAELGESG